jgi:hypothetical protein|tara:strand:+ start:711 stop:905 length:195 start_codon:yes stop_codon:yes gene_type:complete
MRTEKQNYVAYYTNPKTIKANRTANILDLIKNNKIEEKKEKIMKIYTLTFSFCIVIFFITIIIL